MSNSDLTVILFVLLLLVGLAQLLGYVSSCLSVQGQNEVIVVLNSES